VPQARQNNRGAKRHNFPTGNFQLATIIHHSSFINHHYLYLNGIMKFGIVEKIHWL